MARLRFTAAISLGLLLLAGLAAAPSPATAQTASLSVTLTASKTKAKVGDLVDFTVVVTNNGTTPVTDLTVSLNLPDALDGRAINCPFGTSVGVTDCTFSLSAGSAAEVHFFVRIGVGPNGRVVASLSDGTEVAIPAIKIIGPRKG